MNTKYYILVNSIQQDIGVDIKEIDYEFEDMTHNEILDDLNDIAMEASQQFLNCLVLTEEDVETLKTTLAEGIPVLP